MRDRKTIRRGRPWVTVVVVALALGVPAPAQAATAAPSQATLDTVVSVTSGQSQPATATDAGCDEQSYYVKGTNILGLTVWRFTMTLRLCWAPDYCPCVIVKRSIQVVIDPHVASWSGYHYDGIVGRDHRWCDYRQCYYAKRWGQFSLCVGPICRSVIPWVWIKGYPRIAGLWPEDSGV